MNDYFQICVGQKRLYLSEQLKLCKTQLDPCRHLCIKGQLTLKDHLQAAGLPADITPQSTKGRGEGLFI